MPTKIQKTTQILKLACTGVFTLLAVFFAFQERSVRAYSGGPPASRTGAPGEPTCAMVACHNSFAPNSGPGTLTFTGLPANYTPNQEVNVTVTLMQPNRELYGFELTVIDDQGRAAGTLTATEANRTRIIPGTAQGNQRQYIQHTALGIAPNGPNQNSWTFRWRAPAEPVGRIRFFAAGNAADGSGNPTGDYIYTANASVQPASSVQAVATVSAASFTQGPLASETIAALFAAGGLADSTVLANSVPLPTTLGNVVVKVKDAANVERDAPLFFVSPGQINFLVPQGSGNGAATLTVLKNGAPVGQGPLTIESVGPGLFTANANGQGVPAAVLFRLKADGQQSIEAMPAQIDLGPAGERVFLIAFGTGFRNRSALNAVTCTMGGENAAVSFAGAQGDLAGLDQANIEIPRALIGRGLVNVILTVDGKNANTVQLNIK
jgi:uncharacterized protein (TIGR03437 family)